jgi:hypothetical protein
MKHVILSNISQRIFFFLTKFNFNKFLHKRFLDFIDSKFFIWKLFFNKSKQNQILSTNLIYIFFCLRRQSQRLGEYFLLLYSTTNNSFPFFQILSFYLINKLNSKQNSHFIWLFCAKLNIDLLCQTLTEYYFYRYQNWHFMSKIINIRQRNFK